MWHKSPSAFISRLVLWEVGSETQNRKHRWDKVASVYSWSFLLWLLVISSLVICLCSLSLICFLQLGHDCSTSILKLRWQTPKSPDKLLGKWKSALVTAGRNKKTELHHYFFLLFPVVFMISFNRMELNLLHSTEPWSRKIP